MITPLGDQAIEIRVGSGIDPDTNAFVHSLGNLIDTADLPGIIETIPAYDTLLAIVNRDRLDLDRLDDFITQPTVQHTGRSQLLPVCYGESYGVDLTDVADHAGLTPQETITAHCSRRYQVYCIGFSPGFAYLGGMDSRLTCPRLNTPRLSVPAGSIAIGGQQTGIYPLPTPGGWRLIGRTPQLLFSSFRDQPSTLSPGDTVQFVSISPSEFAAADAAGTTTPIPVTGQLGVVSASPNMSIQDSGRIGWRRWGVGSDGALDMLAHQAANLLVGNDQSLATVESFGPCELEVLRPVVIAVTGGVHGLFIDGQSVPAGLPVSATDNQRITIPPPSTSMTWYLAVAGGIDVPRVLGSRSMNSAGCGGGTAGRPITAGDQLPIGKTDYHRRDMSGRKLDRHAYSHSMAPLRVIPGPDQSIGHPWNHSYTVSPLWNRTGIRLSERAGELPHPQYISTGITPGVVQFPGDGRPIILHRGSGTLGGYPRLMTIISADIDRLVNFVPGTTIKFQPVSLAEADRARHDHHMRFLSLRSATGDCRTLSLTINGRRYAVTVEPIDP